ncbi:MAG: CCA tRNA nucleotidyltransferase [Acetobacteraceae bacterium]|jgi:poly(A) polymerase
MSVAPVLRIPPPAFLAEPALAAVMAALPEARVIGGAVRDTLATRSVVEIDLATPRTPEQVTEALQAAEIRAVPTGIAHGTVTAVADGRGFEVTTLRRDVETDGRHAVVAFTDDWRADAARRDFTINAMSLTRAGEVFDYFNGVSDLHAGVVRFVGEPATRIAEDYLRILRFFRFFARYAKGKADAAALAAIRAGVPGLARLSVERVWSELARILAAHDPRAAVVLMAETGVLGAVLPEGADPKRLARLIEAGVPDDPLLRVAALLTGDAAALSARLRLSAVERDRLVALRAGSVPRPGDDDAALRRLLADETRELLIDRAWLTGGDAPEWVALRARLAALPRPVFPLEGRDVLALGEPEGPRVGVLLRAVRQWWLDGGCVAGEEACRSELARRV